MKAIRKGDGKEVDVILFQDKEYIDVLPNEHDCKLIYPAETLVVDEVVDWQAFRREAAKDILASFASNSVVIDDRPDAFDSDFYSKIAVEWADSLIKQLKKKDERPTP